MPNAQLRTCLCLLALAAAPFAFAQEPGIPPVELPEGLEPYGNVPTVLAAALQILSLMKTARVEMSSDASRPSACNRDEILSIYRGMALAHAGYRLFVNRLELGWVSPEPMRNFFGSPTYRSLLQPSRLALVEVWRPENIARMVALSGALAELPPAIRLDLMNFLSYVRVGKDVYYRMHQRAPKKLSEIERVSAPTYSIERREAEGWMSSEDFKAKWPEHLYYEGLSQAYRELAKNVRDVGQPGLDECLDGDMRERDKRREFVDRVSFGPDGELVVKAYGHYPTAYTIGFWRRRQQEGMTKLADFVIARVITELKTDDHELWQAAPD